MIDKFFKSIPEKTLGILALVVGLLIVFGFLGKMGIPQILFHTAMVVAGVGLILWGLEKSDLLKSFKKLMK